MRESQAGHLGAHHCSINFIEVEQYRSRIIPGFPQVAVEETPAQRGLSPVVKIHCQKGDVIDQIDPAQVLAEFDTVEKQRGSVKPGHVGQMNITVTLADEPFRLTLQEYFLPPCVSCPAPAFQHVNLLYHAGVGQEATDLHEIL